MAIVVAVVADVGQVARAGRCRRAPTACASRSFMSGSSEWPPASSLASSPCSAEQRDGLVGGVGAHVVEGGRDHDAPPPPGSATTPVRAWPASSMSVMPKGDSASTMALMTAGAEPIVPASPMPFTPSGLVGLGVTVWSSLKLGTSAADGTQVVGERRVPEVAVVVVDRLLPQRLGDALHDAAVHLALDDQRVDLVAAVVDGDVVDERRSRPVSSSTSTTAHVGAEREREVRRVVGDLLG